MQCDDPQAGDSLLYNATQLEFTPVERLARGLQPDSALSLNGACLSSSEGARVALTTHVVDVHTPVWSPLMEAYPCK